VGGGGLSREDAQRRAVAEFGEVREIARGYQAELGLAQGRRTALLVCAVLAPQHLVWDFAWHSVAAGRADPGSEQAAPGYAFMAQSVEWLGGVAIVGALLAALACGIGLRYLGDLHALTRAIGVFGFAVSVCFVLFGLALTVLSPVGLLSVAGLPWLTAFLMIPLAAVALSARRCLATA